MQYIAPVFYYKKNWSHVVYLKWQNCEIYIAIISVSGAHMPISGCNFSVQQ